MVTLCASLDWWLLSSVAVHDTLVGPSGNKAGALLAIVSVESHRSLAVGGPSATGVPAGELHSATTSDGAAIVGASVSTIEKRGDTLKKHASIGTSFSRPCVVNVFGTVTGSEPSFAVLATRVAKLPPLSVDDS